jgi:hypothetical protein
MSAGWSGEKHETPASLSRLNEGRPGSKLGSNRESGLTELGTDAERFIFNKIVSKNKTEIIWGGRPSSRSVRARFRQRVDLVLELIVLRHQLAVLQRTGTRVLVCARASGCSGSFCRDGGWIGGAAW